MSDEDACDGASDVEGAEEGASDVEGAEEGASDVEGAEEGATDAVRVETRERIASDPYCERLGVDLVDLGPGRAATALTVTEDLLNFHGTPHGGAVYSLADAAFAAASNSHGETALALETNISYLDAAEVGDRLTATAEETHLTRRTAEYEVVVETGDDERVATFRGRVYRP